VVPDGGDELSAAEAFGVIDMLADAGALYLVFTGGEIFAREDFLDVARHARRRNFALRLLTNGTLVTKRVADEIEALAPLAVEVSVYGVSADVHEAVTRVPGSHARTLEAVDSLINRGVKVVMKFPVMGLNVREFGEMESLAGDMGAGFVYDPVVVPRDDGNEFPCACGLGEDDLARWLAQRRRSECAPVDDGAILPEERLLCSAALNTACISPCGDVHPCVALKRIIGGNLRSATFSSAWNSPAFENMRAVGVSELSQCASCGLLGWCDRCAGVAMLEGGTLASPSRSACTMARARKRAEEISCI
jgi:radical SAM protein with 4Fe4S-binding SPASM domain